MMTTAEPAVIISKQSGGKKKDQEKKNQGPTRDEVFGRVDDILVKLIEDGSTNQVSQLSHMPIITVLWSRSNLVPALDKKKLSNKSFFNDFFVFLSIEISERKK